MTTKRERILGAVLGGAIGDAMGAPTEFMSLKQIKARYGRKGIQTIAPGARYTDDTQMAEIVLRSLLESQTTREDQSQTMTRMAEKFVEWSKNPQGGHRAPGGACLAGCAALARGIHWSMSGGKDAGGCGSVMRAWPFGIVFAGDEIAAEGWAANHSRMTHQAPMALAASAAVAVATSRLVMGSSVESALEGAFLAANRYDKSTASLIDWAIICSRGKKPDDLAVFDRLRSWSADEAIAAGLYCLARYPNDARKAIILGANTPGDSDSIASIGGALVGANVGIAGMPAEWVANVERSADLLALAENAAAANAS